MKNNLFKRLLVGTCTVCMLLFTSLPVMAAEYPDVSTGAWYYSYVQGVSDKGLMSGYNDGRFGPNDKLTRGQFATVLWRMNGSPDMGSSSFADVPATSFYAKASEWARVNGVITGYSDGRFGGNDNINREQVATILYRYSGGEANGNIWEYPDGSAVSTFAREGMAYAVGNGIISGDNGYLNPQGDVVRAVAATMISRFHSGNADNTPTPQPKPDVHTHNFNTNIEHVNASCTSGGYDVYKCSCGETTTSNTNATGHNWHHYDEISHMESKFEDHIFCGQCGHDFGAGNVDAALAEHFYVTSPSCENYHSRPVYIGEEKVIDQHAYDECTTCGARQ